MSVRVKLAGAVAVGLAMVAAAAPPAPPAALARTWRLVVWNNDFSGTGLSAFTLAVADGRLAVVPAKDKPVEWGRTVSEVRWADGRVRFKVSYIKNLDFVDPQPPRFDWFDGRYDPAMPDRVWGVLGADDPADDGKHEVRPAELTPAPADGPKDNAWSMPTTLTPGLGAVGARLITARVPDGGKPPTDDQKWATLGDFMILEELAAARKPNRRGFHMLRELVRNAHLGHAFGRAGPAEVEGWLAEVLGYATPYGPRYLSRLRTDLAADLEQGKDPAYAPLIVRLRSGAEIKSKPAGK